MSARLSLVSLCALLLILTQGLHHAATAKPPELPADEKIICAPPSPVGQAESENAFRELPDMKQAADGSLLIELGTNWDVGLSNSTPIDHRIVHRASALPFFNLPASPAGKRQFLQCALFGISPAMALLPVEVIFDADEDKILPFPLYHSHPDKGGCYNGSMRPYDSTEKPTDGEVLFQQLASPHCADWSMAMGGCCHCQASKQAPAPSTETQPATEYTCPYLQQQAAEKKAPAAEATEQLGDALSNLGKLAEARKAYRQATYHRHHGDLGRALSRYEKVRSLCPGSRYDQMATRHVKELSAQLSGACAPNFGPVIANEANRLSGGEPFNNYVSDPNERMVKFLNGSEPNRRTEPQSERIWFSDLPSFLTRDAEFEEDGAKTKEQLVKPADQTGATTPEIDQQVADLLERSQVAYAEGCFDAARDLAQQAVALDPNSVAANALVYKMHFLIQLQEKSKPDSGCNTRSCPSETMPDCPTAERLHQLTLQPALPPVDPESVTGLEKVLLEVEESQAAGLEIVPEDSIGEEEQERSASTQALDFDFDTLLRNVANALSDGSCAEVDHSRPEGMRVRFQGQVAGLWIELQTNGDGHGSFTVGVPLFALPADDLRAMQWAHNEQVLHWIETISGGGEENCENEQDE